ncbi:SixA phosphatase family protein [Nisaea sediminum]|uniref:SixA phosphatase family protein n=1 Tax=Nisaea sediminum TaxID=2775867 RepID=UPI0018688453|nr:histidine phosphatase family protein [Nisaea sediminum]
MTRSLILLRHAKSSWDQPDLNDFDRPLSKRGERAALVVGKFLEQERVRPDLVLCSEARRTMQTWEVIRPFLPRRTALETTASIYEAGLDQLFKALTDFGGAAKTLLMIGHNPGFERLALALCQGQGGEDQLRLQDKFPTCALAFIDLDIEEWSACAPGAGTLTCFVTPKDLV